MRAGEIVGIAGVAGNGQSELLESIAGMRDQQSGDVVLNGNVLSLEGDDGAHRARLAGLAHVPEDRQTEGLVIPFEEWENNILGYQHDPAYGRGPLLDIAAARRQAEERMQKFDVRPVNARLKTGNFSGGNQQKIVLAREMEQDPDVLVVGQPTRGVDIGAIEFIHNQIIKMRDAGKAILLVSVELDEIRSLSDRILVMFDGRIVGEADPATATEGELGLMMAGISGILIAPVDTIFYDSGFLIGLKAFVGAIIGGLVSYPLTVAGALFVGILESFASFQSSAFKDVIVFSLLIPVLLWRSVASVHSEEEIDE